MGPTNLTIASFFIIKGISDVPKWQVLIFLFVLVIYLLTLGGNMTILLLVCLDPQLHTPMYFFLGNLSLLDMSCTTVTLHNVLISFISGDHRVSYMGCMLQFYTFASLTGNELLILTAMSYDRYVAICNPLHYHMVMSRRVCVLLALLSWLWGFIEIIPHVTLLSHLSYPEIKVVNHFFCDLLPLLNLSCSDTSALFLLIFISGLLHTLFSFSLTFTPYVFIIRSILKIRSSSGRRKAFYTCSSHITVVVLLYTTLVLQYLRPISLDNLESSKLFSLFNTALVPMLNPLIYSLKNKDVKAAMRRRLKWRIKST